MANLSGKIKEPKPYSWYIAQGVFFTFTWPAYLSVFTLYLIGLSLRQGYHYFFLNNYFRFFKFIFGERENAGQIARLMDISRIVFITLSMIGLFLIPLIAPHLAAAALIGTIVFNFFVTMNFLILFFRSSSHTVKIQSYYDTEWRWKLINIKLGLLHGMEPFHGFRSSLAQIRMLLTRYLHDLNGLLGTLSSWLVTLCAYAATITSVAFFSFLGPVATFFMPVASGLFVYSHVSRGVSVLGAPLNYKYRLSIHSKNITDEITLHYDLLKHDNFVLYHNVNKITNNVFESYPSAIENKYYHWVRGSTFYAIERVLRDHSGLEINPSQVKSILDTFLENGPDCAFLDALPIYEETLYQKLIVTQNKELNELESTLFFCEKTHRDAFILYFKSAWLKNHDGFKAVESFAWEDLLKQHVGEYLDITNTKITNFNEHTLKNKWPMDTSHGNRLLVSHQIKELAESFAQACDPKYNEPILLEELKAEQKADQIWLQIIKGDTEHFEGEYDEHDPFFYGIRMHTKDYLKRKLLEQVNENELKIDVETKIKQISEKSTLQSVKKFLGWEYLGLDYKADSRSFNPDKWQAKGQSYETPWLQKSSEFASLLAMK